MIHFIGAGPGAADLITVRGARLIAEAEVIVYAGSLVSREVLRGCREDAKLYNSAEMDLPEVLSVLRDAHAAGLETVRLHTGDPCIFGAVREQMDALDAEGIPYDVVPGVSSFCGAAAAMHMELTLPGISQTVILTRASGRTPVPELQSLRLLAAHGATMVLFLSAGLAEQAAAELTAGGYAPDTPCAVAYRATWPDEKILYCTLNELPDRMQREGIARTALIFIGKAVAQSGYDCSCLYDPSFTTGFREGKP